MGSSEPRRTPPLPPGAERRKADRVEMYAQVEVRRGGDVMVLPVVNISAGGLLMRNEEQVALAMGEDLTVFVSASNISFTMEAAVVRCDAQGIAVMWTTSEAEPVLKLAQLLELLQLVRERTD